MSKLDTNQQAATETAAQAAPTAKATTGGKLQFKVKKRVTLPIRKLAVEVPLYARIEEVMFKGKKLEKDSGVDKDGKEKEPVDLLNITDLETGEEMQVVVGKVLKGNLVEAYPDNGYVGKCFEIIKGKMKGSGASGYHPYSITEIELQQ